MVVDEEVVVAVGASKMAHLAEEDLLEDLADEVPTNRHIIQEGTIGWPQERTPALLMPIRRQSNQSLR